MGVDLSTQVLGYAFLDFTEKSGLLDENTWNVLKTVFFPDSVSPDDPYISPVKAADEQLEGITHAVFLCCGPDPLTEHDKAYREMLERNGVVFKGYPDALHGFLEVNHKEYPNQDGKNSQQEALAKDAENYIAMELKRIWKPQRILKS